MENLILLIQLKNICTRIFQLVNITKRSSSDLYQETIFCENVLFSLRDPRISFPKWIIVTGSI